MAANLHQDPSFLMNKPSPQIYVVCFASQRIGKSHGAWVDVTLEVKDLVKEIKGFLARGPVPDGKRFKIYGYKGFYSFKVREGESLKNIRAQAAFISEHGELGAVMLSHYDKDIMAAQEAMHAQYRGAYRDELHYATRFFNEMCLQAIPNRLRGYVDYLQFKKDIFPKNYFSVHLQGVCHVFSNDPKHSVDEE